MSEATLKSALVKTLRISFPNFTIFRHEDKITYSVPDISITGNGKTTWIECKLANPKLSHNPHQELRMKTLEHGGSAFYVIWEIGKMRNWTHLVRPYWIDKFDKPDGQAIDIKPDFDHELVVNYILKVTNPNVHHYKS